MCISCSNTATVCVASTGYLRRVCSIRWTANTRHYSTSSSALAPARPQERAWSSPPNYMHRFCVILCCSMSVLQWAPSCSFSLRASSRSNSWTLRTRPRPTLHTSSRSPRTWRSSNASSSTSAPHSPTARLNGRSLAWARASPPFLASSSSPSAVEVLISRACSRASVRRVCRRSPSPFSPSSRSTYPASCASSARTPRRSARCFSSTQQNFTSTQKPRVCYSTRVRRTCAKPDRTPYSCA
ncbi:hypothetical protein EDB83DRAFT_2400775 [Lactarius deliciosus]|nr:hypothetical protein EDB83DRAFT_2400775 [Lactarius deliciosus]